MTALPGGGATVAPIHPDADDVRVSPTRDRLLRAAREVVEVHGYGGASVAAIADRAGVANGTLYRHFGSKAELFVEVFRDVCGREVDAMEAAVAAVGTTGAPGLIERAHAPLEVFAGRALRNRTLAWALLAEPVDALVDEVRLEYRRTYRDLLAGLLAEAIAAGALPEQSPGLTAAALVGAVGEALVGPVSPARPGVAPAAGAGRPESGSPAAPSDRDDDAELLAALRVVCRRATGAASRVGPDAPGEPR